MPKESSFAEFHDGQNQFKVPFVMYADFEAILKPTKEFNSNPEESCTKEINQHIPSGFCVNSKFAYRDVENPLKLYGGKDCVEVFCDYIVNEAKRLYHMFPEKPMNCLTSEQLREFNRARKCHICLKKFQKLNPKVRDHCHYTGQYRGPAHRNCNLRYKIPSFIPIVFHNLSGCDAHLFIRELGKKFDKGKIGAIAENKEKYISFNVDVVVDKYLDKEGKENEKKIQLKFIDSMRFMASSLDSLSSNQVRVSGMPCNECGGSCEFTCIDEDYIAHGKCSVCYSGYSKRQLNKDFILNDFDSLRVGHNCEQLRSLIRKGVYPYEYMSSWDKFEETKLPPKEAFHSNLNMSDISKYDYKHAQKVWKEFKLKNLEEYHDLYLKTYVLLLSNMFEAFRNDCLEYHKLDLAHFYTTLGLAWQVDLKNTGVKLELLTNPDMLLMFEKGIRGGITQAVHRYAKANNKYMGEKFHPKEESSFLQYLDPNNLYGWARSQPLPTGGFKWVNDVSRFTPNETGRLAKRDSKGYLYPKELHDLHNDLPFMCDKMKINKVEKLVPNLYDKKKYVIHIRASDQALKHGLILEKVHRVIEFNQSEWLAPYINFNTKLRKKAKNDFEKDFFKLMNNAVFGKTMENIRKHKDIKLLTNKKNLRNVMKPNFKSGALFGEILMGCEMGKIKVVVIKPVYLGQAILDLSKIVMYEFHYDYMKPKYGENLKLCYMDTDSLVYHIKTDDFYEDIAKDVKTRFDTSGYNKEDARPLPIGLNMKVIGFMKDELGGKIMTEFIESRPVKKMLDFDDYKKCLFNPCKSKSIYRLQLMFRNRKHEVHTVIQSKLTRLP